MTNKQIQKMAKDYLLPNLKLENYFFKDNFLLLQPIDDFLKGICFDRTSTKEIIRIYAFIMPIYIPLEFIPLSYKVDIKPNKNTDKWLFDFENMLELLENVKILTNEINTKGIDFLNKFTDIKSFYDFYKKRDDSATKCDVAYSSCYAGLKTAKVDLNNFIKYIKKNENIEYDFVKKWIDDAQILLDLLDKGEDVKPTFEQWKKETLSALKLI